MQRKPKEKKQGKKTGLRASKRRISRPKAVLLSRTKEQDLISKIVQSPIGSPRRELQLQDLVYNTAQELQSLAFKAGFNLGAEAYRYSDRSIASLEHLLENAGMGKVIYYPFESKSVITSRKIKSNGINVGANIHVFEAGVISGYLSAHAKKQITAREQTCVFNGSSVCEFMATAGGIESSEHNPINFSTVVKALTSAIPNLEKREDNKTYYMLAIKPLLNEPVFSEATKFLYLTGKLLSRNLPRFEYSIVKTANFLGIDKAKFSKDRKENITISLRYTHDTSSSRYVDLSTAMLAGIIKGEYGRNVKVIRSVDRKRIYSVKMLTLRNQNKKKDREWT